MTRDEERASATAEPRDAPAAGVVATDAPRGTATDAPVAGARRADAADDPRPGATAGPAAIPTGERRGTGALSVARSVGAAMIGVQSRKNRERDFTEGKPIHFIIGGLIGTLLFLLAVWLLVQYLIATS